MKKDIDEIYTYFKILKNINLNFRKLIKHNMKFEEEVDLFYIISGELLRLFPFKIKYDESNNFLYEFENDGIMLLKDKINDLNNIYINILTEYYTVFYQLKIIRNKYEHEPHNIRCVCFMNGKTYTEAIFKYKDQNLVLNTFRLYKLILEINKGFKIIKNKVLEIERDNEIKNKLKNYKFNFLGEKI